MYFTSLPNHQQKGFDEQLHFSQFKKHNIIFNATAKRSHCDRHVGCLSIKTVLAGEERYGIGHYSVVVRPGQFLILNDNQEYSCTVDRPGGAAIQSFFFRSDFASAVFSDLLKSEDLLLDDPFDSTRRQLEFFQTLYTIEGQMREKLSTLISALENDGFEKDMVNEHFTFLLRDIIIAHKRERYRAETVNAVKKHTRTEIYKRLCIARDFLHSTYTERPDLAQVASVACMSQPQLIRQFKTVFQTTPHQYLTDIRLMHASRLLKTTDSPLSEIVLSCGFENVSSFCRLFKKQFGLQPIRFRNSTI